MKTIKNILLRACMIAAMFSGSIAAKQLNTKVYSPEVLDLLHRADKERDWMTSLLENADVDPSTFSIEQVEATLSSIDKYTEGIIEKQKNGRSLDDQSLECLRLLQEVSRHLNNARRAYQDRLKTSETFKRAAVPLGVGAAVAGGLLAVNMVADIGVDVGTALVSGIAAGTAAGLVTCRGEVLEAAGDLKEMVADVFQNKESVKDVGKVAASVAGAAAVSGLLWHQRDTLLGLIGFGRSPKKSLQEMADETGL